MHNKNRKPATPEQQRRLDLVKRLSCVACWRRILGVAAMRLPQAQPTEVHHLIDGGRRVGHDATIPLCSWHHRGVVLEGVRSSSEMVRRYGPSLAMDKRAFVAEFGSERSLLEYVDRQVAHVDEC